MKIETNNDHALTFTVEARNTIRNMTIKCQSIEDWYGKDHPKTIEAWKSLALVMTQMIQLGGRITSDGDLDLNGYAFISYGVAWHRDRNANSHADTGEPMRGAPETGTWSTHS